MQLIEKLDLKRSAKKLNYPGMKKRLKETVKFVDSFVHSPVLDIGEKNDFGIELSKKFNFDYEWTDGDLDRDWWPIIDRQKYKTVFCCEILEHLKNPDHFLNTLRHCLHPCAIMFISFPRHFHPCWWSKTHFHEFDELRAKTLFHEAGYEILDMRKYILWPSITGVRPALRAFLFWRWFAWQYFYLLRLKR